MGGILTNPRSTDRDRIAAGNALMDRGWGKAETTNVSIKGDAATLSDAELVARLEQLRAERVAKSEDKTDQAESISAKSH